jgi:hypothetical protein
MERVLSRWAILAAAVIAAIILLSIAAVFLCGALYLYLVSLAVTPALAALLVGLATITAVGLIILAVAIMSRHGAVGGVGGRTVCEGRGPAGQINDVAENLGSLAARELASMAQAHPYRAFVLALLGGLAVGHSPELRQMLNKRPQN